MGGEPRGGAGEPIEPKETGRIEAFRDGVIAIAITLLVIELKVPHVEKGAEGGLIGALIGQSSHYLAYLVSFWSIGLAWIVHHGMFNYIRRTNHTLLLLNMLFLMCIALVPYPTAIVAEYLQDRGEQRTAVMIFSALWLLLAVSLNLLWWYATSRGLVDQRVERSALSGMARRLVFGPPLYLLAFLLALVSFEAAVAVYLLIGVLYTAPSWGRLARAAS
jgi:uncharacterized membrane protein